VNARRKRVGVRWGWTLKQQQDEVVGMRRRCWTAGEVVGAVVAAAAAAVGMLAGRNREQLGSRSSSKRLWRQVLCAMWDEGELLGSRGQVEAGAAVAVGNAGSDAHLKLGRKMWVENCRHDGRLVGGGGGSGLSTSYLRMKGKQLGAVSGGLNRCMGNNWYGHYSCRYMRNAYIWCGLIRYQCPVLLWWSSAHNRLRTNCVLFLCRAHHGMEIVHTWVEYVLG
jgi:hypothetical protein